MGWQKTNKLRRSWFTSTLSNGPTETRKQTLSACCCRKPNERLTGDTLFPPTRIETISVLKTFTFEINYPLRISPFAALSSKSFPLQNIIVVAGFDPPRRTRPSRSRSRAADRPRLRPRRTTVVVASGVGVVIATLSSSLSFSLATVIRACNVFTVML